MTDHIGETNEKVDKRMTDHAINEAVAQKLGWFDTDYVGGATPDYCHSIAAAWKIVENFQLGGFVLLRALDSQWEAGWVEQGDLVPNTIRAWADTAPMAICLAFLRLKETP